MFTVWGVNSFSLTSEDYSATLQNMTSTLKVHPKRIQPPIRRDSVTTNEKIVVIIAVKATN
jgi:hypothetical protein